MENVFITHPRVKAALVAGIPDNMVGEKIGMLVVPNDGELDRESLAAWALPLLEKYKIPDIMIFSSELPLGATGKSDRKLLRQMLLETV